MTDTEGQKTVQLRRYDIIPGELDAFVEWWTTRLEPGRSAFGYTLLFAYVLRETNEFVWAVSAPGDAAAFEKLDAEWMQSDERKVVFDGVPQRVAKKTLALVDEVVA